MEIKSINRVRSAEGSQTLQGKEKTALSKTDWIYGIVLFLLILSIVYCSLGFLHAPISSPLLYEGGDDFSYAASIKQLIQENWVWRTERLGAPFGANCFDFMSSLLQNTEYFVVKVISIFCKDVYTVINIQYLLTFAFAGISAYLILRLLKLYRLTAFTGGLLYGLAPYIFLRGIIHYCLSACYFIPFSAYLCVLSYRDGNVLTRRDSVKKTILVLLMCFLVANNGIAYYPFFTCFFLCITMLYKWLETRRLRDILPAVRIVVCIVVFLLIAMSPSIIFWWKYGRNLISERIISEAELYGLKIAQLFIPVYSHGIAFVRELINNYRQMPLINENYTSYQGIVAAIGVILSVIEIMKPSRNGHENTDTGKIRMLFSRFNIGAILFMTVGGFISLISVVTNVYLLRGYNRVSIFIMFFSLFIVLSTVQDLLDHSRFIQRFRIVGVLILVGIMTLGLWDQTPEIFGDGASLNVYRELYDKDDRFVKQIEDRLEDGAMVFQLPYHAYPEGGHVNQMIDYKHMLGYLHSDTLKWSYGGTKKRQGDRWYQKVGSMDIPSMIDELQAVGFMGLYVDKTAYTEEEYEKLRKDLRKALGEPDVVSEDGNLTFYEL